MLPIFSHYKICFSFPADDHGNKVKTLCNSFINANPMYIIEYVAKTKYKIK